MGYTLAEFFTMFIALFVILTLGVIFKFKLGKAPLAVRQIPLHVIGALLLIFEVIKQIYHIINHDWILWYLPLHFCSFFLVWYGIALFTRGKTRQLMYFCSLTGGFMVSVLLFIAPRMILHDAAHDV
ncbi:MAG: YwaF family protein [Clostridia bacterium]|nr:YwaF family protein [Clostridia bacterium]